MQVKCKNQWKAHEYGVHKCQVNIELYCINFLNLKTEGLITARKQRAVF